MSKFAGHALPVLIAASLALAAPARAQEPPLTATPSGSALPPGTAPPPGIQPPATPPPAIPPPAIPPPVPEAAPTPLAPKSEPAPLAEPEKKKLVEWSSFDIQYLFGFNWQLGARKKDIVTLEHADGWKLGDNYLFVDVSHVANQAEDTSNYGEWQPRFSFSKIIGKSLAFGPVQDILETNRLAFGSGFLAHLSGIAVDLGIPHFSYWHQHVFVRHDIHLSGVTWQVTSEWAVPITLGPVRFVQDGFVHFIGAQGTSHFNIISQLQLLLDLGNFAHYEDQLFLGTEVDLRYNEFGISGKNEAVPRIMAEWRL